MLRLRGPRGGQAPLEHGLIVGRGALGLSSPKISRKHVEVLKDGDRWQVRRLAPNPAKLRRAADATHGLGAAPARARPLCAWCRRSLLVSRADRPVSRTPSVIRKLDA